MAFLRRTGKEDKRKRSDAAEGTHLVPAALELPPEGFGDLLVGVGDARGRRSSSPT